jgi:hypothetical protein
MNQKKGKEKKHKKQMLRKTTKRRKQLVDRIAAVVVIRDPAEFCFARLCRKNVEKKLCEKSNKTT